MNSTLIWKVLQTLLPLGMRLYRCGGPNDRGIDIRVGTAKQTQEQGSWELDSTSIPIIIQCKNTKQSKPQFVITILGNEQQVREFVGVMNRESATECKERPVGLLCLSSSITNSLLRFVTHSIFTQRESALSNYPFALVRVIDNHIKSFQPNYALLRCYPDLHFVFDVLFTDMDDDQVNATDIPTILYKNTVLFHS